MHAERSPAEELPALYRSILDGVARLERTGARAAAAKIRSQAVRQYSTAWDEKRRRELEQILRKLQRSLEAEARRAPSGQGMPEPEVV